MYERTFRRWRDRFEVDGAEGLFTAKHFHKKLVAEHGCKHSYNWVRLTLQARAAILFTDRRESFRLAHESAFVLERLAILWGTECLPAITATRGVNL